MMCPNIYSEPYWHVVLQNNVKMPVLGLGTSHNGGYCHEAVVYALRHCGYRHVDTAKRYGCEEYIAQAIKDANIDRSDVFLASKCWPTDYGEESIKNAVAGSCQRLQTNYLDLYLLHWPYVRSGYNRRELINESWRSLEHLYDEGVIRAIGVSNFLEPHLEDLLEEASVIPHVNQCEFHPFNNPVSLRKLCQDNRIQFEGYSPLAKGIILKNPKINHLALSLGRTSAQILIRWCLQNESPIIPKSTKPKRVFENSQGYSPLANGVVFGNPYIKSIAESKNKTCSQIVLRWNIQNCVVCIPKSTKKLRVKENSEIFDFQLNEEEMNMLNSLPQCVTVIDSTSIQEKIDNPLPDGYKLKIIK